MQMANITFTQALDNAAHVWNDGFFSYGRGASGVEMEHGVANGAPV